MRRHAFAMLLLVLACGAGCGKEKPLSTGDAGGDRGPGLDGVVHDGGVFKADANDAAVLDASVTADGADASDAMDANAAAAPRAVWTNRTQGTAATGQLWLAVASDGPGKRLVAVSSTVTGPAQETSGVWASLDSGATWAHVGERNGHGSVAANAAGSVFIVAGGGAGLLGNQPVWTFTNSGTAWDSMIFEVAASAVASDATGTRLVAAADNGWMMTSSDSGAHWTNQTPSGTVHDQNWISVASSGDGTKLVALSIGAADGSCPGGYCPQGGDIWTSTDSGVTWTDRTPTGPAHNAVWSSVASDSSGLKLVAVGAGIWTSVDAGVTWTQQTAPSGVTDMDRWASVASDATGKRLIAATYGDPGTGGAAGGGGGFVPERPGYIFTSTNGGVTWTNETIGTDAVNQNWVGVATDAAGVHSVAIAAAGDIWTN